MESLQISETWDKATLVWLIRVWLDSDAISAAIHGRAFPRREHLFIFSHSAMMTMDKSSLWDLMWDISQDMAVDEDGCLSEAASQVLLPILDADSDDEPMRLALSG